MQKYLIILALLFISCNSEKAKNSSSEMDDFEIVKTSEFQLIKSSNQKGLLILFPCFPCDAENTLTEFKIADISVKNGFSVLAMNLNQRLFLENYEKHNLAELLNTVITDYKLTEKNVFIGGFSSGGNVSLLISNYLIENNNRIQPKGVFVVDSPVDLLALYKTAEKNLKLNYSNTSESSWIKMHLDDKFGNPINGISNYEMHSSYTFETENINNLQSLEKVKLRFYTEPDLEWWRDYAQNDYEDLNAYYIEKLVNKLSSEFGNKNIELIQTENKGYRASGEKHPHSWSIIDENDLISWMAE
jgi:hypothetical protein